MAENKRSFVLYADLIHTVKKMPKEKAGELFMTILSYVNDLNPVVEDMTVDLVFEPIKQQLKRDLVKWEGEIVRKSEGGAMGNLKRWHPDLYKKVIAKSMSFTDAIKVAKNRTLSDTDSIQSHTIASVDDNVSDSGTVNVSVIETSPNTITIGTRIFKGTTSEWLMLNKEAAIETLMMNNFKTLNLQGVLKRVDAETNQYHFKDENHPYNFFKNMCNKMIAEPASKAEVKKYKSLL